MLGLHFWKCIRFVAHCQAGGGRSLTVSWQCAARTSVDGVPPALSTSVDRSVGEAYSKRACATVRKPHAFARSALANPSDEDGDEQGSFCFTWLGSPSSLCKTMDAFYEDRDQQDSFCCTWLGPQVPHVRRWLHSILHCSGFLSTRTSHFLLPSFFRDSLCFEVASEIFGASAYRRRGSRHGRFSFCIFRGVFSTLFYLKNKVELEATPVWLYLKKLSTLHFFLGMRPVSSTDVSFEF